MQTDKELGAREFEGFVDVEDQTEEEKLQWLLETESSEPEETLFRVQEDEYRDEGLSEFEAEFAARPMFRGNEGGDDLANYVAEEIVISSDTSRSDIYGEASNDGAEEAETAQAPQYMAVDHSRRRGLAGRTVSAEVAEGSDLLGLSGDDDMGEAYLTIRRVRGGQKGAGSATVAAKPSPGAVSAAQPAAAQTGTQQTLPEAAANDGAAPRLESTAPVTDHSGAIQPPAADVVSPDAVDATTAALPETDLPEEFELDMPGEPAGALSEDDVADFFADAAEVEEPPTGVSSAADAGNEMTGLPGEAAASEEELSGLPGEAADCEVELTGVFGEAVDSEEELAGLFDEAADSADELAEAFGAAMDFDAGFELDFGSQETASFDECMPAAAGVEAVLPGPVDAPAGEPEEPAGSTESAPELAARGDEVDVEASGSPAEENVIESVSDYLGSLPRFEDDEAFDAYLLRGSHLDEHAADPEELVAEDVEEALSVDVFGDVAIDYPEDFSGPDGLRHDLAAQLSAQLPGLLSAVNAAVQARLVELGLPEMSVQVDAMLGTDEHSIRQCYAEGFDPLASVCAGLAEVMEPVSTQAGESIYLRLLDVETKEARNDLFSEEFGSLCPQGESAPEEMEVDWTTEDDVEPPAATASAIDTAGMELPSPAPVANESQPETAQLEGAGDDIFGMDLDEGLDDTFADAAAFSGDIDAAFSSLGHESETGAAEICGIDIDEFEPAESETPAEPQDKPAPGTARRLDAEREAANEPVRPAPVAATGSGEEVVARVSDTTPMAPAEAADEAEAAAAQEVAALESAGDASWCIPPHIRFNFTSQSGAEIFDDFLDAFIEEGSAEVEKLEDLVSEWEKDVAAEEVFAQVARTLHTLKGIAKGVGLQRFGTLIHNFETLLDALPRPRPEDAPGYFRVVNVWLDTVVRGIEFVTEQRQDVASELPQVGRAAPAVEPAEKVEQEAEASIAARTDEEAPVAELSPEAAPRPAVASSAAEERERKREQQIADEGAKALAAQQSVRITSDKLDHLLNLTSQTQQLCVRASQMTSRGKRSTAELQGRLSSVRTHIAKIADRALLSVNARGGRASAEMDALEMDQYSELQEAASILREGVEDLADLIEVLSRQNSQVEVLLKQQSSVISSISSSIQAARVVPVSRLMPGLRRLVRTVSTDLGKVVTFKVLSEIGALDRDRYARLQVALEHMVRNALDHGIESPEERLAAGKPSAGRITIDVRKSGGNYIIKLADDGRGIDPDTIRESAYQKGLDIDVDALSDEEAIRLIFHKGFSTAAQLSEISGRGVGMDIVLTELQQIGGDIQIQSAVGLGTSFEVRIPSNVTVNGALLVAAADHSYAIPLNGLIAVEQVPVREYYEALEQGGSLRLYDMECKPAYLGTLCQGVGVPERGFWENFVPLIIAGSNDRYMAIAIDNVKEALELVVRSLGSQFASVPGVAGAATTADGDAVVALDLNLLVESVGDDGMTAVATSQEPDKTLLALVVDDSRTQRMVATSQLDTVGVETVTAENGLVAIDLLNATHRLPDVVLLDVEMPVKDGIETLREIRKSQRYGHLPVIMVTSRTGAKHRALAKEAGCNAYMGKPFNFPALIEQINVLTGHDLQIS